MIEKVCWGFFLWK